MLELGTGGTMYPYTDDDLRDQQGLTIDLHSAIPVPNEDVPFEDILEFKVRRRSELLALRHHLEDIYQRILLAGDGPLALNTEKERLQRAIEDQFEVLKAARLSYRLSDLRASFTFPLGVSLGGLIAGVDFTTLAQLCVGGTVAQLSVRKSLGLPLLHNEPRPFSYAVRIHSELFCRF